VRDLCLLFVCVLLFFLCFTLYSSDPNHVEMADQSAGILIRRLLLFSLSIPYRYSPAPLLVSLLYFVSNYAVVIPLPR